ncbi:hypothetical protein ACFL34_02520 [Candidatus Sumerlaeota bacterium]
MEIDKQDRRVLRELGKQVRDIAANPIQEERKQLWHKINRLERCRIPVLLRINDLYWNEIVPDSMLATTEPRAREYERRLRLQIWQWETVDDDCVTEPVIEYRVSCQYPRVISAKKTQPGTKTLGAYQVVPVIEKESDIDSIIVDEECSVDWDATARNREWTETVFDEILTPVRALPYVGISPFDYVCEIRGMDNVFIDMLERPEWFEEVMRRLYRLNIDTVKRLEHEGALALNNSSQPVYNGGLGYTDQLPAEGFEPDHVRLKDVWGFSAAQSAVSISPEMHERFITSFEREYHQLFGLTAVACCETVDRKMRLFRTLPNLRRISICAWNDFARAAEEIGADYIYSVKPSAVPISQPTWNPEQDRELLRDTLEKAKGCRVEIIHYEIATCYGKPERLTRWSKDAKELAEQYSA